MRTEVQDRDGDVLGVFRLKAMPRVDDEIEVRGSRLCVGSVTWVLDDDAELDAVLVVC